MDQILIEGIQLECVIGTYDWERKIRQKLTADLVLEADLAAAGEGDALEQSIDYAAVVEAVEDYAAGSEFQLIEALAQNIADLVLDKFPVNAVELTVNKGAVLNTVRNVGVRIRRQRGD